MTPAFHHVPRGDLERVIAEGVIRPGIERISHEALRRLCFAESPEAGFDKIWDAVKFDYDRYPSETTWAGFVDLVQAKLDQVAEAQRRSGHAPSQATTQFTCIDLLAGDLEKVFLSVWNWAWWVPKGHDRTGFVFDADFLIEKGACLRPEDMLRGYEGAVIHELSRRFRVPWTSARAIERAIARVKRDDERCGEYATAFLQGKISEGYRTKAEAEGSRTELALTGPLPLEWAVEQVSTPAFVV